MGAWAGYVAAAAAGAVAGAAALQAAGWLPWLRWLVGLPAYASPRATAAGVGTGGHYGMRHQLLNMPTQPTLWNNMGLWTGGAEQQEFAAAAAALARRVARAATLAETDTVLDVGYGCGDQVRLWYTEYQVGEIVGVTLERAHAEAARALVAADGYSSRARLYCHSATELHSLPDVRRQFSVVLAVDCAYHFNTRLDFLRQAFELLEPGGRLAMTDLVRGRSDAAMSVFGQFMMTHAFQLPPPNWVDRTTYAAQLASVGFEDAHLEVLDDQVFPGLAAFIDRQADAWHAVTGAVPWLPFLATAAGLRSIHQNHTLHFVLVSARKPRS